MTDKELLELAARAAGITNLQWESDGTIQNRMNRPTIPYDYHGMLSATDWNPLTDDGDALRLAVKLGLLIDPDIVRGYTYVVVSDTGDYNEQINHEGNPYAATRRAIVRAAAEIGKNM